MKITIGSNTYNGGRRLNYLFTSLFRLTPAEKYNINYVIVDDGSPKVHETRRVAKKFRVPLIEHGKNLGISAGWNTIANYGKEVGSDYIVIINDDIIVTENWLESLCYFFEGNKEYNIGMVGLPFYHCYDIRCINKKKITEYSNFKLGNEPLPLLNAPGYLFMISIDTYDLVGGFPTEVKSQYEDVIFGFKLYKRGYLSYVLPSPYIYHQWGKTFADNPELQGTKELNRSRKVFIERYSDGKDIKDWMKINFHPEKRELSFLRIEE